MKYLRGTNLGKHSLVAIWAGWIAGAVHRLISLLPNTTFYFWWFIVIVGIAAMVGLEIKQALTKRPVRMNDESIIQYYERWYNDYILPYLKLKWLDIACDISVGIVSMFAGLLPWWVL